MTVKRDGGGRFAGGGGGKSGGGGGPKGGGGKRGGGFSLSKFTRAATKDLRSFRKGIRAWGRSNGSKKRSPSGPGISFEGDWDEATGAAAVILTSLLDAAVAQEAEFLASKIRNGLLAGGPGGARFRPHSPLTLAIAAASGRPHGGKVLIASGGLVGSIGVVEFAGGYFIGVKRGAKAGGGKWDAVDLANLHENGAAWSKPMTLRQRRWLMMMLKKAGIRPSGGGGGVLRVRLPPRPFVGPVIKEFGGKAQVARRIYKRIGDMAQGYLGRA